VAVTARLCYLLLLSSLEAVHFYFWIKIQDAFLFRNQFWPEKKNQNKREGKSPGSA